MLRELHAELGIPADYGLDGARPAFAEANDLVEVGPNIVGRMQRLTPVAAAAWQAMQHAAAADEVTLLLVSGYRSIAYQARLVRKKINAGQTLTEILAVVAAPGFSEHHSGRAVDIATPGSRPLTEEFEASEAFGWLSRRAAEFGFSLSYPRDNPAGFVYEPWHWAWHD
jgi:D-alanyl-D-alanine carboxypeptidase